MVISLAFFKFVARFPSGSLHTCLVRTEANSSLSHLLIESRSRPSLSPSKLLVIKGWEPNVTNGTQDMTFYYFFGIISRFRRVFSEVALPQKLVEVKGVPRQNKFFCRTNLKRLS